MRRLLLLPALALAFVPHAHAQLVEIYGTVSGIHTTDVPVTVFPPCPADGASCGPFETRNTTNSFAGGGGATFNIIHLPFVRLGLDVRGSKHAGTIGSDTAMGGLKLTIKPPIFHIAPYVQGSVGYLGTTATNSGQTQSEKSGAVEVIGGLDVPVAPFFDLRVIEIGAGRAFISSDAAKPSFITAGAGLVFHF